MPSRIVEEDIQVDNEPPTIEPYEVLGLTKEATQDQIKSAYRKAALKHHPDKATPETKDEAHVKFQEVAFAYAILSDERRRKRYDTTGRTEESLEDDDDFNWVDFYREQFASVVTTEKIDNFALGYKGSDEEREHILAAYEKWEGSIGKIYASVMLSDVLEDDERFRGIIDAAIDSGEVEGYEKYTKETEKSKMARITQAKKRRDKEAGEVAEAAEEMQKSSKAKSKGKKKADGDVGDLAALIQQRQKASAGNFFDDLEAKYAPNTGKKRDREEPPEEAFAKNAKKGKTKAK